jgi:hypothetical protein
MKSYSFESAVFVALIGVLHYIGYVILSRLDSIIKLLTKIGGG